MRSSRGSAPARGRRTVAPSPGARGSLANDGAPPNRPPVDSTAAASVIDPAVILDNVVEAIVVFDAVTLRISEANRRATELLGHPRDELVDHSLEEVIGTDEARRLAQLVHTSNLASETVTTMLEYRGRDRKLMPVEVSLRAVPGPVETSAVVAIARDIGSRIETQVRLQRLAAAEHARAAELNAVIRAMGEAVIVCAPDGSITLANPAAEGLFPEASQQSYDAILAELHDPDRLAPRLGEFVGPVVLRTVADPDRWIEVASYAVGGGTTASSPAAATIVTMRDVTESRRRDAVRETFIGVLSHELRTPVTTIFGGAKLLARESSTLDEETRRSIFRDIHDEAERLQRLVEDVVALNRFGDGPGEVGWEPVLLQRLLPKVVRSEDGRWPGVSFQMEIAPGLPTVSADPTYVEQVVRNLLSNAAKYGGQDPTVVVEAERGAGEVIVRVLDDGPGFDEEERDRLFELFYRSARTAGAAGGAGIGLFVSARLIEAMEGRIWAARRQHGGSEFGFALPELED